ncbi:MAG TPA: hypothetical protein VMT46_09300 [Anaerolineaceae bacterium]|nr:hypothetical protein [Anaerolineaceae bacterium]
MDVRIGTVTHYFTRIGVAVLQLSGDIRLGDTVLILGHTTEFTQKVSSLEIDHRQVPAAHAGMEVALLVAEPVRKGDLVYRVIEGAFEKA